LFCHVHRFQPWVIVVLLTTIGGFYSDVFKPVKEFFFPPSIIVEKIELSEYKAVPLILLPVKKGLLAKKGNDRQKIESWIDSSLIDKYSISIDGNKILYSLRDTYKVQRIERRLNVKSHEFKLHYQHGILDFLISNSNDKTLIIEELRMYWEYYPCNNIKVTIIPPEQHYPLSCMSSIKYFCDFTKTSSSKKLNDTELKYIKGDVDRIEIDLNFPNDFGEHDFWLEIKYRYIGDQSIRIYCSEIFKREYCSEILER